MGFFILNSCFTRHGYDCSNRASISAFAEVGAFLMPEKIISRKHKKGITVINFAQIKQSVTTRQAAEAYGLSVNSRGMCRCPFHNDHTPSMKVDETFYCFGCGAVGDVITFTARLFGISAGSAARKLEVDFGIVGGYVAVIRKSPAQRKFEDWVYHAREVLREYNLLLVKWKSRPPNPGEDFPPHFTEALQNSATAKELLWELSFGTEEEKQDIYLHYKEKLKEYEQRIHDYDKRGNPSDAPDQQQGSRHAESRKLYAGLPE